jgi:hypothetical protein
MITPQIKLRFIVNTTLVLVKINCDGSKIMYISSAAIIKGYFYSMLIALFSNLGG